MYYWSHNCTVNRAVDTLNGQKERTLWQAVKKKIEDYITISPDNPHSMAHFPSMVEIEKERRKQLATTKFVIHPFSKFKSRYDVFTFYLYILVLLSKPIEFSFIRRRHFHGFFEYGTYFLFVDVLCWIDICVNFSCGYVNCLREVELDRKKICRHYVYSLFFVCDVLSSINKKMFYNIPKTPASLRFTGVINILCMLKIVRLISVVGYYKKSIQFYNSRRGPVVIGQAVIVLISVAHWLTCLQYGVPRFIRMYMLQSQQNDTWFIRSGIDDMNMLRQYFHSMLKSTAYILGVRITKIYEEKLPEEFIMGALTYLVGKIIVALLWVIFAITILNYKSVDTKFAEVFNQLNEYMTRKQLPLNLRERISSYYIFKYRKKYLNEKKTTSYLSNTLMKDVNLHKCNSLLKSVSLFSDLNTEELGKVIDYLVPEIFLPNETIVQSGTPGNAIYFIASGTVAVYTHSGREICHLQDGGYFGEISLIIKDQARTSTVVAIEITQVYRLDRKSFDWCLLNNDKVMEKLTQRARGRLRTITILDDEYKKRLFEQSMQEVVPLKVKKK